MDHTIYTAMGAASRTLNQQAITVSNLANAPTPGFCAQLNALHAAPVEGLSLPTHTLVMALTPGADMTPGRVDYISRPLNVALQQDGQLAVQIADDSEGYTHNSSIQADPTGQLTVQGRLAVGETGPIAVSGGAEITIAADDTISVLSPGDPTNTVVPMERLKLVKATGSGVQHGDDGIFRLSAESQVARRPILQADPTLRVISGVLEGGSVNAVATTSGMIVNARRFEMQMGMISSVNDNAGHTNQLLLMGQLKGHMTGISCPIRKLIGSIGATAIYRPCELLQAGQGVYATSGKRTYALCH